MRDSFIEVVEPEDNVGTLLGELAAGDTIEVERGDELITLTVSDDVGFGHKVAIEDIDEADTIRKYGKSIGNATQPIEAGSWVHVHNVESNYGRGDLAADSGTQTAHE